MSLLEHLDRAKAEYCRAQAAEALEQAAKMKDPDLRATWEFIARSYHGMGDRLEQNFKPSASATNRSEVVFR
jgi:hypothetical protein